jgi:hypothetical protein
MDTFKEPFVFLVLDAESAFVGIDEIPLAILWNANTFEAWISLPIAQASRNLSTYLLLAQCIADGDQLSLTFSPRTHWIVATSGLLASKQKAVAVRTGSSIANASEL